MKCSVFIATSVDGYIASHDGGIEWLEVAGKKDIDMGEHADMGTQDFFASVDCLIMGSKSMEKISSFNLTAEQWPYKGMRVIALSNTIKEAPQNIKDKVEIYSGDIGLLMKQLEEESFTHAYIDGGMTITAFLNLQLINEITVTQVPILLGEGKPLFGKLFKHIKLENARVVAYPNDFVQFKYDVRYL